MPPEVEAFYDKMTTMNMVGDMGKFTQFQTATSIEKAAENEGGGAGAGVGIGAGFAMGNLMSQNMNQQNTQNLQTDNKEDIMKMLKELGELKTAGILTEEEFNAKKTELLAKL